MTVGEALDQAALADAWERVAGKGGAAGVDRVSVRRFARQWEAHLRDIRREAASGLYKPRRLRKLVIAKADGSPRAIGIPAVRDRVLQRAVLDAIDYLLDRQFLDCSFGFRAGRGVQEAVAEVMRHRHEGVAWALHADIDDCFDSLDHELLLGFLSDDLARAGAPQANDTILPLIRTWLHAYERAPGVGVALGAVISPLLCNVYLHRLDEKLVAAGYALVRYADDFIVLTRSEDEAHEAWGYTAWVLKNLKLRLNPQKTCIASFDKGFDFLGVHFQGRGFSYLYRQKRVAADRLPLPPGWPELPEWY